MAGARKQAFKPPKVTLNPAVVKRYLTDQLDSLHHKPRTEHLLKKPSLRIELAELYSDALQKINPPSDAKSLMQHIEERDNYMYSHEY